MQKENKCRDGVVFSFAPYTVIYLGKLHCCRKAGLARSREDTVSWGKGDKWLREVVGETSQGVAQGEALVKNLGFFLVHN